MKWRTHHGQARRHLKPAAGYQFVKWPTARLIPFPHTQPCHHCHAHTSDPAVCSCHARPYCPACGALHVQATNRNRPRHLARPLSTTLITG